MAVALVESLVEKAVKDRFLLKEEADKIVQQVTASAVIVTKDGPAQDVVAAK
jgi:hypothetical protein